MKKAFSCRRRRVHGRRRWVGIGQGRAVAGRGGDAGVGGGQSAAALGRRLTPIKGRGREAELSRVWAETELGSLLTPLWGQHSSTPNGQRANARRPRISLSTAFAFPPIELLRLRLHRPPSFSHTTLLPAVIPSSVISNLRPLLCASLLCSSRPALLSLRLGCSAFRVRFAPPSTLCNVVSLHPTADEKPPALRWPC